MPSPNMLPLPPPLLQVQRLQVACALQGGHKNAMVTAVKWWVARALRGYAVLGRPAAHTAPPA